MVFFIFFNVDFQDFLNSFIFLCTLLVGFGRMCVPVRCAYPSFWAHLNAKRALRAPHRSFAAPQKIKKINYFQRQNASLQALTRAARGRISFHWAKLHPYELHCTLLSYDAPS
jgi:hypothetical protein